MGLCLTLVIELSRETQELTKQEILLRTGTHVENSKIREPRKTALPRSSHLGFYSNGVGFWPIIQIQGPSCCCVHYSAKMDSSEKSSGRLVRHM